MAGYSSAPVTSLPDWLGWKVSHLRLLGFNQALATVSATPHGNTATHRRYLSASRPVGESNPCLFLEREGSCPLDEQASTENGRGGRIRTAVLLLPGQAV